MTRNIDAAAQIDGREGTGQPSSDKRVPILKVRVFGGFDVSLDDSPIESAYSRQRRIQALMSILALNHGQDLFCDYLADSIWPRSTIEKKRHSFYNLWYLTTRSVYEGKREENPYFERRQGTCRMLDAHVHTDVQDVEQACIDLMQHDLEPYDALEAYRRLQEAYRGDLLPGEMENGIIIRARRDWRERVSSSLSVAAQTMTKRGEDRVALWMATAACRLSGMREDVVRLRMELLAKMGMQAYAVRTFNELEDYLQDEVGMAPSPQSVQLIRQVVDASDLGFALAVQTPAPRRRGTRSQASSQPARREPKRQEKAEFACGDALPMQVGYYPRPM